MSFLRAWFLLARRWTLAVLVAGSSLSALTAMIFGQNAGTKSSGFSDFALDPVAPKEAASISDATCIECHRTTAEHFHQTAHFHTSDLATADSIKGNFAAGANELATANPGLSFKMDAMRERFTQTGRLREGNGQVLTRTEAFDLVVGSGRKGQTYLYWSDNRLFELPVSYWSEQHAWVNSPGYVDGTANFDRPIPARCLECHATAFNVQPPPENAYVKASLVLGISCEKCHGPGADHVALFRSAHPPQAGEEKSIVNPAHLARERQIEICALCHSGPGTAKTPALSFKPGDVLAQHLVFPDLAPNAPIDVHASQVQLLERSHCFQKSSGMTCSTCHDVHMTNREPEHFATRCISCHAVEKCGEFPKKGRAIAGQCVTCHMPLQQTDQIVIAGSTGKTLQPRVRNHRIAIYRDVTLP